MLLQLLVKGGGGGVGVFCLVFPSTASPSQQENVEFIEFHFIFSHLT